MAGVGITEIGVAIPGHFISMEELAKARGLVPERITDGLGLFQARIPYDISIPELAAQAVRKIRHRDVTRFWFATESDGDLANPSLSVKTLRNLELFNLGTSVLPIQTKFACLAGVQNLISACEYVALTQEPAVIVMADISIYDSNDPMAEVTSGCGAVALRIEPSSKIEVGFRRIGVHVEDIYDFYVPAKNFPFPVIDGPLSTVAFCRCVKLAYQDWQRKNGYIGNLARMPFDRFHFVSHTPFPKMVVWSMAAIWAEEECLSVESFLQNRDLLIGERKRLRQIRMSPEFRTFFEEKVAPFFRHSRYSGNTYTGGVFMPLVAVVEDAPRDALMIGYGSGAGSVVMSLRVKETIKTDLAKQIQGGEELTIPEYEKWREDYIKGLRT